jgi:hypothetical protein
MYIRRLSATLALAGFAAVLATAQQPPPQPLDVSGEWTMTVTTDGGPITAWLVLKQEGEKITGSIRSEQGELPLEGTVKDKTLSFWFQYPTPDGNTLPVSMTGTVEGDTVKGTWDAGGMMAGEWTASRKK